MYNMVFFACIWLAVSSGSQYCSLCSHEAPVDEAEQTKHTGEDNPADEVDATSNTLATILTFLLCFALEDMNSHQYTESE